MKRFWLCAVVAALILLCACGTKGEMDTEGLHVVTTLFPQYDFARAVAGDLAEVTLLLPPGVESHSYEPTPADIIRIQNADAFLYTGAAMEPWAESLVETLAEHPVTVLDTSRGIALDAEHDHADPHIWTNPENAIQMVESVVQCFCALDPAHAEEYRANGTRYQDEIRKLDEEFQTQVTRAKRKTMVFGGRFAFHYFAKRYGLTCYAAYDSCAAESEPSAAVVASLIERVRQEEIPVVYYEEMTDPKIARAIAEETGAELLLFHTCHNVTAEEREAGATYLSLMRQNLENLRKGLN